MTLRFSKYVEVVTAAGGSRQLQNRHLGSSVGYGPRVERAVAEILADREADLLGDAPLPGRRLLLQVIGYELASRGILVREDVDDEREHLDCLAPPTARATFFGLPLAAADAVPAGAALVLFGAGCDLGAAYAGSSHGPALLRAASRQLARANSGGFSLVSLATMSEPISRARAYDLGDLELPRAAHGTWLRKVRELVARLPAHATPIMVGGDHSLTLSAIRAIYQRRGGRPFTIVQFDHHLDLELADRLPAPTHANFMSHVLALDPGMRALQLGVHPYQTLPSADAERARAVLARAGRQVSVLELMSCDPRALAELLGRDEDVYVTVDVDVLASELVRSTAFPAPIGLDYFRLATCLRHVLTHNRVLGLDVMEFGASPQHAGAQLQTEALRVATLLLDCIDALSSSAQLSVTTKVIAEERTRV